MHFLEMISPFFEIAFIALVINYLLSFFWNTRSLDLMFGLFALIIIYGISSILHLPILKQIMFMMTNVAAFAVIVILQPELRVALSKMSLKGKRFKELSQFDSFLDHLAISTYKMAEKRTGAIIALQNEDSLDDFANKAVMLNANFSSELLESIFTTTTPLHDGAIIIRDQTLVAASVIFPLAEDSAQIAKSLGTRHRAALGASQQSDALLIVISEESGKVSIARDGIMTRGVKIDRFRGIIRSIFNPPLKQTLQTRFKMREWLRQ